MSTQEKIQEIIGKTLLFSGLPRDVLTSVVEVGKLMQFTQGQTISIETKGVEFLNVLLKGELSIKKINKEKRAISRVMGPGAFFGSIDAAMGLSAFHSAVVTEDSVIFSIEQNRFRTLMEKTPELYQHLLRVKLAVSVNQESAPLTNSHSPSEGPNIPKEAQISDSKPERVNPLGSEMPKDGRIAYAELPNGDRFFFSEVQNTSAFLRGENIFAEGDEIRFRVFGSEVGSEPFDLVAEVRTKSERGVGIRLSSNTDKAIDRWEQFVAYELSKSISEKFRPNLKKLTFSLPLILLSDGNRLQGSLIRLGVEGAIFECEKLIQSREVQLGFTLRSPTGNQMKMAVSAYVMGKDKNRYLVRFFDLKEEQKVILDLFVSTPIPVADDSLEKPRDVPIYRRTIQRPQELTRVFLQELSEQVLTFHAKGGEKMGDRIQIEMIVDPERIPVPKSRSRFLFSGSIQRMEGVNLFAGLGADAVPMIQEVKAVVDSLATQKVDMDFRAVGHQEINRKNRRYMQLILVILLLGASVVWVFDGSFDF